MSENVLFFVNFEQALLKVVKNKTFCDTISFLVNLTHMLYLSLLAIVVLVCDVMQFLEVECNVITVQEKCLELKK